ncbi:imidazolonepropionase [Salinimonas marina]|uniref:Imidazolonepropionase n=1 Tax=Salinimonas marina TaxID=2785918 RepID=A0A7S9HBR4_9ALTE|nr:imidazolonepropionase [Salinimonas marina]QPG04339.1 imidazolonepropionase [Salinimonas marina]
MAVTLIDNVNVMSMDPCQTDNGIERQTQLWIQDDKILAVGSPPAPPPVPDHHIDGTNRWALPGFIDCHTHLVYGGSRADEFRQRLSGTSYQDIARAGGGIQKTVRDTRNAGAEELLQHSLRRGRRLIEEGVTTLEIKSGYGLDQQTELTMLEVAARLGSQLPVNVSRTYLGAHTLPPEFEDDADGYIDFVCHTMIPTIAAGKHATAVDVFCETVGFTRAQAERVFAAAQQAGLAIKLHAEQLSDSKGAVLAAQYQACSVDHIEYLAADDIPMLAKAGCVAVLLPGAFYYLRESKKPPVAALRQHQVPMAVASDHNPGTSPICSLLTCATMACLEFGLTCEEALLGITSHAAQALQLSNKGRLRAGMDADVCLWDIREPADLIYEINGFRPTCRWVGGQYVDG